MGQSSSTPFPVVRRLSHYLQFLRTRTEKGKEWVSSLELAAALDLTSSTVRQDLSHVDVSGKAKRGYEIQALERAIITILGRDRTRSIVVVGAGNLGRALARHEEFPRQGLQVCGLFDSSRRVIGKKVGKLVVRAMEELPEVVSGQGVELGVIAVPAKAAQKVADQLVASGVRGVLNMACAHVQTPETVAVVDARLVTCLNLLSYAVKARRGFTGDKETGPCQAT